MAAQGGANKSFGSATWVTVSFVVLGVLIAVGSGYQAFFKPGERSPKFAAMALDYIALADSTTAAADRAVRQAREQDPGTVVDELETIMVDTRAKLSTLRRKEIGIYVTGPTGIGVSSTHRPRRRPAPQHEAAPPAPSP